MASAEEVQALKREVAVLKQMLNEQERGRGSGGGGSGEYSARSPGASSSSSPNRLQQQDSSYFPASKPFDDEYRRDSSPSPRRPATAATSPSRAKTIRWKDTGSSNSHQQQLPQQTHHSSQSAGYTQFIPVDTKRGKWWLKDRQILSRNVPAPNDRTMAMKVRETWQWSGRTVVIDKIVTGPRPRDDDDDDGYSERDSDHRVRDLQDEAARYREELRRLGNRRTDPTPTTAPLSATTVAAQVAFHDSKQLAKEFIQPKSATNAVVEELSEPMRTASQRMEAEMAKAVAAATSEGSQSVPVDRDEMGKRTAHQLELETTSRPQASPSKVAEGGLAPLH